MEQVDITTKRLRYLCEKMEAFPGEEKDSEHSSADDILCQAVMLLEHPLAQRLVKAWTKLDKWYS